MARQTWCLLSCFALAALGCRSIALSEDPFGTPRRPTLAIYEVDWWARLVTQLPSWEFDPRELATPAADPKSGTVFVGTRDGVVRSVSPPGKINWSFQTRGKFDTGPAFDDQWVYVAATDGFLYALRARDGSVVWEYNAGEELATTPVIANGKVFVSSITDILYAVDQRSGKWLWQYRRDLPNGFTVHGASRPTVKNGVVYSGFADGHLVALSAEDGSVKWDRALSSNGDLRDVDTSPILDDAGRIYAASYRDGLYALDAESGTIRWHTQVHGLTSLVSSGPLLVGAGDEQVTAFLAETGKQVWSMPVRGAEARRPVVAKGALIVPTRQSLLFADAITAAPLVKWNPGQGITATPSWTGNELYVLSNEGVLYAMRLTGNGHP